MDNLDINSIIRNAVKEFEEDKYLNLLNLVTTIISTKKRLQVEELIIEGKLNGYSDEDIYKALDKLEKDRVISVDDGIITQQE